MHNPILAKRYADALLDLAIEQNKMVELKEDIQIVQTVFKQNEELIELLNSPRISKSQKTTVIETSFKDISKDIVNMILLLVERQRTELIKPMFKVLNDQILEKQGIAYLEVYTTQSLSASQNEAIIEDFKIRINKPTVLLNEIVDPSIIGGLKIRYRNTVYDGSVKNSLNRLRSKIKTASN